MHSGRGKLMRIFCGIFRALVLPSLNFLLHTLIFYRVAGSLQVLSGGTQGIMFHLTVKRTILVEYASNMTWLWEEGTVFALCLLLHKNAWHGELYACFLRDHSCMKHRGECSTQSLAYLCSYLCRLNQSLFYTEEPTDPTRSTRRDPRADQARGTHKVTSFYSIVRFSAFMNSSFRRAYCEKIIAPFHWQLVIFSTTVRRR